MPRAIDIHVHPATREFLSGSLGEYRRAAEAYFRVKLEERSVDEMADEFRRLDIVAVLLAWDAESATGLPPVSNDFVAGCAGRHPDVFLGFASVDPLKGDAAVSELERAVRQLGLRGLKMHPTAQGFRPDDRRFYPLWEAAAALRIPVMFHTGTTGLGAGMPGGGRLKLELSRPILLDTVAADFPELQIIAAHPSWPWQQEMLAIAMHKPNIWIDLSGWSPRYFPQELVREIKSRLQDRCLFGTDYPFVPHERWFAAFDELGLEESVKDKILKSNAARLLGLELK